MQQLPPWRRVQGGGIASLQLLHRSCPLSIPPYLGDLVVAGQGRTLGGGNHQFQFTRHASTLLRGSPISACSQQRDGQDSAAMSICAQSERAERLVHAGDVVASKQW